jgi:hypothetical protein
MCPSDCSTLVVHSNIVVDRHLYLCDS